MEPRLVPFQLDAPKEESGAATRRRRLFFKRSLTQQVGTALASASLVVVLGLTLGCSDRAPTAPETSALNATSGSELLDARGTVGRFPPRLVSPRGGSAPALQGVWGGEHIGITITSSGASVDYDCAEGSIDAPFTTDTSGRFNLAGSWWFTPPVFRIDWQPDKRSARYMGIVTGDLMSLTVTRLDDGETMQFALKRNAVPRILRCL